MPLTLNISPLAYKQTDGPWLADLHPYFYQQRVYELVERALKKNETLCIFLVTPTGSGKTLGSYAYAINSQIPCIGVYPTNELIRDQEKALRPWIAQNDEYRLLRIDSQQLDHWQAVLDLGRHASTLERLMNWQPTILTNPDILFYTFFGLYRGPQGLSQRLFALLGQYQLFVFDEFHLYNVKQMADVAYLVATLHTISPTYGRVFIFASATPESPARHWLGQLLGLPVEVVEGQPSDHPTARTIAQPLQLTLLPADLQRWKGGDTLLEYMPELQSFVTEHPQTRLVSILDSVAGAIGLAQNLRDLFPDKSVGEVHGFSSDRERSEAMRRLFTVGTSTIEVGIDFKGETEKDVLIYEARTASQFIQRFGRLARHAKMLSVPNWTIALVPEYVYHYMAGLQTEGQTLTRQELYRLVEDAYQQPEDFARYLQTHAPAEFHAARWQAQGLFQPDERARIVTGLESAIHTLTGKTGNQAWGLYRGYEQEKILTPLLTFRGSGFEAAILDERGSDPGCPAKRYNLMFLLRRCEFQEIDEEQYHDELGRLAVQWPEDVTREGRYATLIKNDPEELLGVYGFFRLDRLLDKTRKVWFEIGEEETYGRKAQVTVISGLEAVTDPEIRMRRMNRNLRKKRIVAWFVDRHPASIKLGRALPPLFEIHELRVRRIGGGISDKPWSIVFNQDAFFVDSLGWWQDKRMNESIIL